MRWRELEPGVWLAEGDRLGYLVWFDESDCQVKLTRWHLVQRGWPTIVASTGLAREAARHLVMRQLSRGPGRPPMLPDAEASMARLRDAADAYEGRSGAPELNRSDWLHLDESGCVTVPDHHAGDRALLDELARYTGHIEDMDPEHRLWMLGALEGALSRLLGWPDAAELAAMTRDVPDIVRQLRELANELEDAGAEERTALLRQAASELDRRQ